MWGGGGGWGWWWELRSSSKDSDETYGLPRPAPWPEAPPRWAAALAAYPQSWTCLDATRHVDSLRQERKKKGVLFFCYTPIIHGCLGQGPLLRSQSSWPQQKNSLLPTLTFHQGFYMGAWRTGRCWWLGRLGTHPHYPAAAAHVLGKTRMDPSFNERERAGGGERVTEVRKKIEKKEQKIPPSILPPARRVGVWKRGLGGDAERVETWSWRLSEAWGAICASCARFATVFLSGWASISFSFSLSDF